jgi:mRNA interferase MazF
MVMVINRFDVWLVNLDPTVGREIKKTRPCLVVSPNEANKYLDTISGAPMTTTIRNYPTRINCRFRKKGGQIAVDQLRSLDKSRLLKRLGKIDEETSKMVCSALVEYFIYQ